MLRSFQYLSCTLLLSASVALAQTKQVEVIGGQELLIYRKPGASLNAFSLGLSKAATTIGAESSIKRLGSHIGIASLGASVSGQTRLVKEADLLAACNRVKNSNVGCEINYAVSASKTPNDTLYSSLYGMTKIGAPAAWEITTGSSSVAVAVVDTGVDYTHPDLSGNIAINTGEVPSNGIDDDANGYIDDYYGYDFSGITADSDPMDDNDHGSHVSGTIGGRGNNSNGVVGVNWQVGIIPVKVLQANGSGSTAGVIAGMDYAVARGARIVNMSLGGGGYSQAFYDSIARARDRGVLLVAAAGNESNNNDASPSYPASYGLSNIISVAATDSSDHIASFSNFGASSVHLAAPGVSIISTLPGGTYASFSGTSMACPHVAGAAALVASANSGLNVLQIKDLLLNNVDSVSGLVGLTLTGGRLNVNKAVAAAAGTTPAPSPTPVPTNPPGSEPSNPGDGGGDGGDDGDEPSGELTYYDIDTTVKGTKASVVSAVYDLEEFALEGVSISVTCGKKTITKFSNEDGETTSKFSFKAGSTNKCSAIASDGLVTLKKKFKVKVARGRRR